MSWPDTPTSQPNWSPSSMKSDGSQQPQQQQWPDSQPSPRRTPSHQPAAWQNQNTQDKIENQMSWSPKSENQANWGQQNTKQDMQNSGERLMWQQPNTDSNKQNGYPESQDSQDSMYAQSNRVNLNSRLKSMILNKQQQQQQMQSQVGQNQDQSQNHHQIPSQRTNNGDGSNNDMSADNRLRESHENSDKSQEKRNEQYMNQSGMMPMNQSNESMTGNFLLHSHHPRANSLPDGGGLWEWSGGATTGMNVNALSNNPLSNINNLINYNCEEKQGKKEDERSKHCWNPNDIRENQAIDDKSFQQRLCIDSNMNENNSLHDTQKGVNDINYVHSAHLSEQKSDEQKTQSDNTLAEVQYDSSQKIKQEYSCPVSVGVAASNEEEISRNIKLEPENKEQEESGYKFQGDGGPARMSPGVGSWCCRRGGTEQPTPEHLRDGCCQGLQTRDEFSEDAQQKSEVKNEDPNSPRGGGTSSAGIKLQEHLEKLKNNVRTEVPDCDCFTADKCELQPLYVPRYTNIERSH